MVNDKIYLLVISGLVLIIIFLAFSPALLSLLEKIGKATTDAVSEFIKLIGEFMP